MYHDALLGSAVSHFGLAPCWIQLLIESSCFTYHVQLGASTNKEGDSSDSDQVGSGGDNCYQPNW